MVPNVSVLGTLHAEAPGEHQAGWAAWLLMLLLRMLDQT